MNRLTAYAILVATFMLSACSPTTDAQQKKAFEEQILKISTDRINESIHLLRRELQVTYQERNYPRLKPWVQLSEKTVRSLHQYSKMSHESGNTPELEAEYERLVEEFYEHLQYGEDRDGLKDSLLAYAQGSSAVLKEFILTDLCFSVVEAIMSNQNICISIVYPGSTLCIHETRTSEGVYSSVEHTFWDYPKRWESSHEIWRADTIIIDSLLFNGSAYNPEWVDSYSNRIDISVSTSALGKYDIYSRAYFSYENQRDSIYQHHSF